MQHDRPQYTSTEMPEWFQASSTPTPSPIAPKRSSRFPLKRVLAIVLSFAIIAIVVACFLVYQSPNRVLSDGLDHLLNAQQLTTSGTITAEDDNFKITTLFNIQSNHRIGDVTTGKMTFQPKTGSDKAKTYDITFDAVSQAGSNRYVKITGLSTPANDFLSLYTSYYGIYGFYNSSDNPASISAANDPSTHQVELDNLVGRLTAQIDGQWVKVPRNSGSEENCAMSAYSSLGTNLINREVLTQYNEHPFLSLKSQGTKDGNYDYVMGYNSSAAQDFDMATSGTQFSKQLSSCGGKQSLVSIESDPLGFGSFQNGSVDVSINQWSHNIQAMHSKGSLTTGLSTVSIDATLNFTYSAKPTFTTPANSISIDDIEKNTETIDLSLTKGD